MEKRIESGYDILYLLQDMREFELYGTVRGIVSVCDSLNYITEQELLKKWGYNYDKYYEKIKNCVDSVYPEVLKYNNNLILSVYHAISSGTTEKSQDVFGQDLDYLTNINSPGDYLAKNYEVTLEISPQEFKNKIIKSRKYCKFDDNNIQNWARDYVRTSGGMIKEITIGSEKFTGKQIREIFELRSANFEIIYNSETNKFNIINNCVNFIPFRKFA